MRRIHAVLLVEYWNLSGSFGERAAAQAFGEVENHISQPSTRTNHHGFQVRRIAGMSLDAVGVLRHVDALHVGSRAIEFYGAGDFSFSSGADVLIQEQRATTWSPAIPGSILIFPTWCRTRSTRRTTRAPTARRP